MADDSNGASGAEAIQRVRFDVVALAASAGGIEAIAGVLGCLPEGFPAAVLVVMHLAPRSHSADIFARHTLLPVAYATSGGNLLPGHVYVAPPQHTIDVNPDGTTVLVPHTVGVNPIDTTLSSVAESYGARALAVILTGMRKDGALGARAIKEYGGTVIAQNPEAALHPSMPRAAIATGAVDLVLPLTEIGGALETIVSRGALPPSRYRVAAIDDVFGGPGVMRAMYREVDWAATSLGAVESWSPELRCVVKLVLASPVPMITRWGSELTRIHNDALTEIHTPAQRGLRSPDFFDVSEQVMATGEAISPVDQLHMIEVENFIEERYFTHAIVPVSTLRGNEGTFSVTRDTTDHVLAKRRIATLGRLAAARHAASVNDAYAALLAAFEDNAHDLPFALAYAIDSTHQQAVLKAAVRVATGTEMAPHVLDLASRRAAWPLANVTGGGGAVGVSDLATRFSIRVAGPWGDPTTEALLLPLLAGTDPETSVVGVLVVGLNRRRRLDTAYKDFLELVAAQVTSGIIRAHAFELTHARAHALAEANRAKATFFSNVSHEFRTPLTLVLGHLERALASRGELSSETASDLDVAARNARRLLGLVSSLLDFSAAETHRLSPKLERVDLAAETQRIAALFHSAVTQAGLSFVVDCPTLPTSVSVDREMWAKIVVNLLSNALKFTFDGAITVTLRERGQHAELVVGDTGIGIVAEDQPHVFDRYFRGTPARARTHEGSGIGLALAKELVRLHRGRIRVQSKLGEGTAFTVWIPLLGQHQANDGNAAAESRGGGESAAVSALAEAALAWTKQTSVPADVADEPSSLAGLDVVRTAKPGARVLAVDDNADMRAYYQRLFSEMGWRVDTAEDGAQALERARASRPDLVVADVMMPKSDGFELLRRIRADADLARIPVVLVTARAGESAAVEGLMAGANDYIAKPFAPRELVARVGAQLELARVRRRAEELNAFLVRFSDAVRSVTDPSAVAQTACRMLAAQLGTDRAYWAVADRELKELVVDAACAFGDMSLIAGRHSLDAWEPFTTDYLAGRSVISDDAQADIRQSPAGREACAALGVAAFISVPVLADGSLRAVLGLHWPSPRRTTPEEVAFAEAVAGRCWAEVERASAEARLRASEDRHAFLLGLLDATRSLSEPADVQRVAMRLLGEHLQIDRAHFAELSADGTTLHVADNYVRGDLPKLVGDFRVDAFGSSGDALRRGETLVIDDTSATPFMNDAERAGTMALGVHASVSLPLFREGRWASVLVVHQSEPRRWTPHEISLMKDAAERSWNAVERLRADEAIRASELKFRTLFDSIDGV